MARKQVHAPPAEGRRTVSLRWILVLVAAALAVTVTAAVRHRGRVMADARTAAETGGAHPAEPARDATAGTSVPTDVMNNLTSIPSDTWRKAGIAAARLPVFVGAGDVGAAAPTILYIGAGFCPYCAAARWSLITALSRFGTFSGLSYGASSSVDVFPRTPTFSFYGAHYTSRYIELQTVEQASDEPGLDGRYVPLEQATPAQEALLQTYDVPPFVPPQGARGIPFILVGRRYMWSGAPFSPQLLANRSQQEIAATLPTGTDTAAHAILVNGNMFTAAICAINGRLPADVCSDPVIQQAIAALPTKAPS
jgi:hypothetical protein